MKLFKRIISFLIFTLLILGLSFGTLAVNEKPVWLITSDDLPKGWTFSTETLINNFRFYISFLNPKGDTGFSIETIQFSNTSEAQNYVINEYTGWNKTDQLNYVFPKDKIDLSPVDVGVNWEVKSACCYSRGVLFSIDYIYIYIFGSQQATWSEVELLFNIQVIKILNFLDRDIPSNLTTPSTEQSNLVTSWMILASVFSLLTSIYVFKRKYK